MTIRRQWLMILILVAVFSVGVNAFVLSSLTDRYFVGYMTENYEKHFSEIVDYSQKALTDQFSTSQMAIELETHLDDPITRIKLYDAQGQLIVDVGKANNMIGVMRNRGLIRRMMGTQSEEVDNTQLFDGDQLIGQLNITRYSSVENSTATRMFKEALLTNSLISIGIVLVFAILLGFFISKKISKDLIQTAALSQDVELGNQMNFSISNIKEIRVIQQRLEALGTQLKLKNKSRKSLVDEIVHQSRTPLTILKNHLEGFEDDIIKMNPEEIKICKEQIENLTSIIEDLPQIIDAEKGAGEIKVEAFDLHQLLQQIISGLKVQFDKKKISLKILSSQQTVITTDRYKLSQAIYNILTNAYKYTDPHGKVSVSYENDHDDLLIVIEDNGIGISPEDQEKIFDAYYRSRDAMNTTGEGIGLFVVKENLEKIQGTIAVESEIGSGSKFIIRIPLTMAIQSSE